MVLNDRSHSCEKISVVSPRLVATQLHLGYAPLVPSVGVKCS